MESILHSSESGITLKIEVGFTLPYLSIIILIIIMHATYGCNFPSMHTPEFLTWDVSYIY